MIKLTVRQENILKYIQKNKKAGNRGISEYLGNKVSRFTILRDIKSLLNNGLIIKSGKGRGVYYGEAIENKLLEYYNPDEYFNVPPDRRKARESFNFEVFENLNNTFSRAETDKLNKMNLEYQQRLKTLPPTIVKKEFERLIIELSWKSSAIEGNTYTLIDTEMLIKENKKAKGKKTEEAIMILNHKKALDFIRDKKVNFQKLTLAKIENVHSLITADFQVSKGVRKRLVRITGTKYKPLDNEFQIREALEKLIKTVNKIKSPLVKAVVLILLISYIQPFEDGNKRTARVLGNAVLLAYNFCPLSYRSIDEAEYKKAMLLFYEQNSARYFKELFMEQFKFAINNYFGA
ncbi:cell filamentation protein Fic [Candidatus Falkowbacteria bacterium CG11_big_fil_rev_8_21_14_0_20_39_10]|uniref:Cell filamentation protein Fic n=1 Tax=Candidatus Falkowbacteria bacterium CG11_big_fil_rev_8_21_14_0_20_39_10 TaxID=1974570 RepID=A0A2M6K8T1_9BACT|nr:MAG: cell filamentation protein Fic [Candidatus Falkowbacteria bacterium CG11_big_fil_rev_8_21_14_0_20_39_10]